MADLVKVVSTLIGNDDTPTTRDSSPLLRFLNALGIKGTSIETDAAGGPAAAIGGPPQSVALIEATATAASKWWSAGLGASVAGLWGVVSLWWDGQHAATQRVGLWMAAIVTAAAVIGIAYLLGSDVRGRAAAAVATIEARAQVGDTLLGAAQASLVPSLPCSSPASHAALVALAPPINVNYIPKASADEPGWKAIALFSNGDDVTKYLVVKGAEQEWADASAITLATP